MLLLPPHNSGSSLRGRTPAGGKREGQRESEQDKAEGGDSEEEVEAETMKKTRGSQVDTGGNEGA